MTVVAKSLLGHEFIYSAPSAHAVAAEKAQAVCDELNKLRFMLNGENETWFVHDVDQYDRAFAYAQDQRFTWGKRGLIRKFTYDWVNAL